MDLSLQGKRILVTREKKQAETFAEKIKAYGGRPSVVPLLKITCKEEKNIQTILGSLDKYEWIFITSSNGVNYFFQLAQKYGVDPNQMKRTKFAVVGRKTEKVLQHFGKQADFVPSVFNAKTMAEEFLRLYNHPGLLLLIRGNLSRNTLPEVFRNQGLTFDSLEVYETIYNKFENKRLNQLLRENKYDFITFTSPSAVEAFTEMANIEPDVPHVCIGTTTEARAKELGCTSILTPEEFTIDGMIERMSEYLETED